MPERLAHQDCAPATRRRSAPRRCAAARPAARLLVSLALLVAAPASAQTTRVVGYRYERVWLSAMRLLRVDSHYKVTDKDRENGYILFIFPGSGAVKECPASLEVIRLDAPSGDASAPGVKLQLDIEHQPSYVELQLLDRLEQKLEADYGPPRPPAEAPPAEKPPAEKPPASGSAAAPDDPTAG
ncbi:MAG: hypothetical protein IPG96_05095 [Proteobacteria bacterium]|nr:hypothetical protein [Pseudomonadota bacterium]